MDCENIKFNLHLTIDAQDEKTEIDCTTYIYNLQDVADALTE